MSDEMVQINLEISWDNIEAIFEKPRVLKSFNESYKESEKLMRSTIENFYLNEDEMLSSEEMEDLLSGFKRFLKGQILITALSNMLINQVLDVENVLIILNRPENQLKLAYEVIKAIYGYLLEVESEEDSNIPNSGMLS